MIGPGDLPSGHAGLRYWVCISFVLTSFRVLVGSRGIPIDLCFRTEDAMVVYGLGGLR